MLQLELATEEAVDQYLQLRLRGCRPGRVTIRVSRETGATRIDFIDNGVPFDPLAAETPDLQAELEQRSVGGLGIFLIRAPARRGALQSPRRSKRPDPGGSSMKARRGTHRPGRRPGGSFTVPGGARRRRRTGAADDPVDASGPVRRVITSPPPRAFTGTRGLDAEIIPGGPGLDPMDELARGNVDFITAWLPAALTRREQGPADGECRPDSQTAPTWCW